MKKDILQLQNLKNEISPFKIGDKVVCYWGSEDYNQEGVVVDNLVFYNNNLQFDDKNSELGCIVKLKNKILPTGFEVGNNEVIPFRQIKRI